MGSQSLTCPQGYQEMRGTALTVILKEPCIGLCDTVYGNIRSVKNVK